MEFKGLQNYVSVLQYMSGFTSHWAGKNLPNCKYHVGGFLKMVSGSWSRSRDLITKIFTILQNFKNFFSSKIELYLFLCLHKGCTSYRRSLQPQKRTPRTLKQPIFTIFSFPGSSCPPRSGSSRCRAMRIWMQNTDGFQAQNCSFCAAEKGFWKYFYHCNFIKATTVSDRFNNNAEKQSAEKLSALIQKQVLI